MSDDGSKPNGSVDLLAKAMRQVLVEAMEPVTDQVKALRTEVRETVATKDDIKTTNENVQAQLAQHREDVADDVRKIVTAARPE